MATFVYIHGAGGRGSDWDLVRAELAALGHDSIAMDLPCDQEVGLTAYRDAAVEAIGDRRGELVLVAQSLGGFTAPLVADVVPVQLLVLLTAMIPKPGETGGEWWGNVGCPKLVGDEDKVFVHDVPPAVLAAADPPRDQTGTIMDDPWPLDAWPDVPTRFLLCMDDRFFPPEWMRGVVRDRLGIEPDKIPGGHCAYVSQPQAVAAALVRLWTELQGLGQGQGRGDEGVPLESS